MLRVSNLQIVIFTGVVVLLLLATREGIPQNNWEVVTEIPTERADFATAVVDGKIYLFGGTLFENARGRKRENEPGIWRGPFGTSVAEVYDPRTNTWERLADMPTARAHARAAVVDGKIYVIGGYAGIDNRGENLRFPKVTEVYDPQTDTWERKQDMLVARRSFGIGVVAGKIYVIGGLNYLIKPWRLDLVEMYDPDTDTWSNRAKMSTRRHLLQAAVIKDTIYAIGGSGWPEVVNQRGPFLQTVEIYRPKTNRWKKGVDMPRLRSSFSAVVVSDRIYVIGGVDGVVVTYLGTVEVYDPAKEKWHESSPMPTGKKPFGVAAVNGRIYVFGGRGENQEFYKTVEVFDTGFRAASAIGKLSTRWGELKAHRQSQP
ncbi:hypothetical protein F4Y59_04140 [Candidatus Poribacteria bacterium]|nr:hypothetical protein [Candidatus Poribacteria bacterium]MYK17343.1 hypothetical protein [Candidatus Poribacteria bacterium]